MNLTKYSLGFPCHKYIARNLQTELDILIFEKEFAKTMQSCSFSNDDIETGLLAMTSVIPSGSPIFGKNFDIPSSCPQTGDFVQDILCDGSIPDIAKCTTFYGKYDSSLKACSLCPLSNRFVNMNIEQEKSVARYCLLSEDNYRKCIDSGIVATSFHGLFDMSESFQVSKPLTIKLPNIIMSALSKPAVRKAQYDTTPGQVCLELKAEIGKRIARYKLPAVLMEKKMQMALMESMLEHIYKAPLPESQEALSAMISDIASFKTGRMVETNKIPVRAPKRKKKAGDNLFVQTSIMDILPDDILSSLNEQTDNTGNTANTGNADNTALPLSDDISSQSGEFPADITAAPASHKPEGQELVHEVKHKDDAPDKQVIEATVSDGIDGISENFIPQSGVVNIEDVDIELGGPELSEDDIPDISMYYDEAEKTDETSIVEVELPDADTIYNIDNTDKTDNGHDINNNAAGVDVSGASSEEKRNVDDNSDISMDSNINGSSSGSNINYPCMADNIANGSDIDDSYIPDDMPDDISDRQNDISTGMTVCNSICTIYNKEETHPVDKVINASGNANKGNDNKHKNATAPEAAAMVSEKSGASAPAPQTVSSLISDKKIHVLSHANPKDLYRFENYVSRSGYLSLEMMDVDKRLVLIMWCQPLQEFFYIDYTDSMAGEIISNILTSPRIAKLTYNPHLIYYTAAIHGYNVKNLVDIGMVFYVSNKDVSYPYCPVKSRNIYPKELLNITSYFNVYRKNPIPKGFTIYIKEALRINEAVGYSYANPYIGNTPYIERTGLTTYRFKELDYSKAKPGKIFIYHFPAAKDVARQLLIKLVEKGLFKKCHIQLIGMTADKIYLYAVIDEADYITTYIDSIIYDLRLHLELPDITVNMGIISVGNEP